MFCVFCVLCVSVYAIRLQIKQCFVVPSVFITIGSSISSTASPLYRCWVLGGKENTQIIIQPILLKLITKYKYNASYRIAPNMRACEQICHTDGENHSNQNSLEIVWGGRCLAFSFYKSPDSLPALIYCLDSNTITVDIFKGVRTWCILIRWGLKFCTFVYVFVYLYRACFCLRTMTKATPTKGDDNHIQSY